MPRRAALRVVLPFALHGLARAVDAAVGVLLHTTLDLPDFVPQALALMEGASVLRHVLGWTAAGVTVWVLLGLARARFEAVPLRGALSDEAVGWEPLLLRPLLTVLALASLAVQPTWPYGFTLPVALTQDWGPAQDLLAAAALVAARAPRVRLPAPGALSFGFLAFLAYALLTPAWARHWDGHPGNEPKTLRMAVALGHWLSLDVEPVSGPMEELPVRPLPASAGASLRTGARELVGMARALAQGPHAVGAEAIRATRVTRQTVRGKEGGVYHVLAPGPSLLLAPFLRADRALNLARGTPGRLALTVLAWNALAAVLAAALLSLLREATGRPGLSAALAAAFALLPPYVFYAWQFYPEMTGALAMAVSLRLLLFRRWWTFRTALGLGLLLAFLPWQHQKFLPVWAVLLAMAVVRAVGDMVGARALFALVAPQALSVLLMALYNFAVTGSVRPDALFLAWGPRGVTTERLGQGLLGLWLDARYGLLPYVPVYLLAGAGLVLRGPAPARLRLALPAVAVYYATVAAADNWSGAVCNLGRYVMPATPWLAALAALAWTAAKGRPALRAGALALLLWSAALGLELWRDPHAANDCAVLLAKADYADGNVYVPNLFLRKWSDAAPGLGVRVGAWVALALALALSWKRSSRVHAGPTTLAPRAVAGIALAVLVTALVLERWPPRVPGPRFSDALDLGGGAVAFLPGTDPTPDGAVVLRAASVQMLVRARRPLSALRVTAEGTGGLRASGLAPLVLTGRAVAFDLPLEPWRVLRGRRGVEEWLYRPRVETSGAGPLVLRLREAPGPVSPPAGSAR